MTTSNNEFKRRFDALTEACQAEYWRLITTGMPSSEAWAGAEAYIAPRLDALTGEFSLRWQANAARAEGRLQ